MIKPFIDAHVHLNTPAAASLPGIKAMGAHFLSINTDVPEFIPLEEQQGVTCGLQEMRPETIRFIGSFSLDNWMEREWIGKTIEQINVSRSKGAVGIKIWKNLGMEIKDESGHFLMIDDDRLDPLFDFLEEEGILVLGHQGEPRNCWLPLDEMTVNSDRDYFRNHPEYHMYLHPEYPSYEEQMRARDHRLGKNPGLRFVGLHLFSLEYDIAEVAARLERFPNSMTDVAERVCHLQLQARRDRQAVRQFMINYQDRLMYGTDVIDDGSIDNLEDHFRDLWLRHWKFFSTEEVQTAPEFDGTFKGLGLPDQVLEKFFYSNAKEIYQF